MRALGNVKPNPPTEAVRQDPLNPNLPGATESEERWGPVCPPQTHTLYMKLLIHPAKYLRKE